MLHAMELAVLNDARVILYLRLPKEERDTVCGAIDKIIKEG